jgi:hypothetical protein
VCYNCEKSGHFIAQCTYKRREEDDDKKKKKEKNYKKDKKLLKKKPYGQAHIEQEWDSSDKSSESKSDDLTTIVSTSHHQIFRMRIGRSVVMQDQSHR